MKTFAIAALAALFACVCPVAALSEIGGEPELRQGLVCDTAAQVERFVALGGTEDARTAIDAVNAEAGSNSACVVLAYLAQRQAVVARPTRNGAVYGVVRVKVYAVRVPFGWQVAEPATWFALEKLPEADL